MLLTDIPSEIVENQFEKITNPILAIFIVALLAALYFTRKDSKAKENAKDIIIKEKDVHIKELNAAMLESAVKNLSVMTSLTNAIQLDDTAHRILETVIRENNSIIKMILKELESKS